MSLILQNVYKRKMTIITGQINLLLTFVDSGKYVCN